MIKKRSYEDTHSLKYLFRNYYMPGSVLGTRDTPIPCQTTALLSWILHSSGKCNFKK